MVQLLYVSAAREPMTQERLRALLRASRAKNEALGITGMLIYKDDSFMQALEGPEDAVWTLYEAIADDSRHESVRLLTSHQVEERDFPDWSMAFQNVADLNAGDMPEGFSDLAGERFVSEAFVNNPSFAHRMLLGFRHRTFT